MLFETNSTHAQANLERSAVAWGKVMSAWGVTPNPNVIEAVLRPDWGKRRPPAAHSQTIFNARKVYDALHSDRKLAKYKWMWRGDTPDPGMRANARAQTNNDNQTPGSPSGIVANRTTHNALPTSTWFDSTAVAN